MPKQETKGAVAWKLSELEKKFLALEEDVQVIMREAKARERRISDLELRNTRLEDGVQQIGEREYFLLFSHYCIVLIASKLTEEKDRSSSSQKPEVSLKESMLEILDCCLSHEERVTDVERKCEDNHQNIR